MKKFQVRNLPSGSSTWVYAKKSIQWNLVKAKVEAGVDEPVQACGLDYNNMGIPKDRVDNMA